MASKLPYRLDAEPLGEGGYARVYRGVHRETGEAAAIKRPRPGDTVGRQRFELEMEVQSELDHQNVMPIINRGSGWYAMPLASRSLTQAAESGCGINGYLLPPIIRDAARGLQYAHRRGFAHRDVNPNNLLEIIDDDGPRWVVSDWGLVRRPKGQSSPRLTRRSRPLGTIGFIAPEALRDPHNADETCDVYSLGMVAQYALTGIWPVPGFPLPEPGWLWDQFVERCTAARDKRVTSMTGALRLLARINAQIRAMEDQAEALVCPRCEKPVTGTRCMSCGRVWD